MGYGAADGVRQKFTSKERDVETGLDFFEARYYASAQGRFTSVDPLMASASVSSPQSWNRYTYSNNSPVRFTDPTGMVPGDYYNLDGKQIGTDGVNDGNIYIVYDKSATRETLAGTSPLRLPSRAMRLSMLLAKLSREVINRRQMIRRVASTKKP